MTVIVKQEHISAGQRGNVNSCPVSLALKEQLGVTDVQTYLTIAGVGDHTYLLPKEVSRFITQFDLGGTVQPMTFEAELCLSK